MTRAFLAWGVQCALVVACAAPVTQPARPSSPFTASDLKLFDDGLDLVTDPDGLGGRWSEDWNQEMRDRVERSDLIAVIEVATLLTDTDPAGRTRQRLVVRVERAMKGMPPAETINLASSAGSDGYASVDMNKSRLLHMRFVLLVKWLDAGPLGIASHFHLASAADSVVARVQANIERHSPPTRKLIERRYDSSKGEK